MPIKVNKYVCLGCVREYLTFDEAEKCRRNDDRKERTLRRKAPAMAERAIEFGKRYLLEHPIIPEGADLNDAQFDAIMTEALRLTVAAYSEGALSVLE